MDIKAVIMLGGKRAGVQLGTGEPLSEPLLTEIGSNKLGKKEPLELYSIFERREIKLGLLSIVFSIHHSRHEARTEEDA